MVIGGGLAGMTAAKSLASQGYKTHLIEKKDKLGGEAHKLYKTAQGEDVQTLLDQLIREIETNENITVHCNTTLEAVDGFVGNFKSTLKTKDTAFELDYGIAVLATGAKALVPVEYEYGKDKRIITSLDLDKMFKENDAAIT